LNQLTITHTAEPQQKGVVPASELKHARRDFRHFVTKTIGGRPGDADVDIERIELESADRLLLCTNGLTDGLNEDEIADLLSLRRSPDAACQQLVDLAVLRESYDDVTVMVADYVQRSAR